LGVYCSQPGKLNLDSGNLAKSRTDRLPELYMGSPSIGSDVPPAYCSQCGCKLGTPARFCNNCGCPIPSGIPSPMGSTSHLGAALPNIGAQDNSARAHLQHLLDRRRGRNELTIGAVLAFIGWLLLANLQDFALYATSSQELAQLKLFGMALVVAGIVLGLRGAAKYRG